MPIRLHKITWLLLIAVGWKLAADLIDAADAVRQFVSLGDSEVAGPARGQVLVDANRGFTWTAGLLASAAMVEFLARIWEQLKLLNARQAPNSPA